MCTTTQEQLRALIAKTSRESSLPAVKWPNSIAKTTRPMFNLHHLPEDEAPLFNGQETASPALVCAQLRSHRANLVKCGLELQQTDSKAYSDLASQVGQAYSLLNQNHKTVQGQQIDWDRAEQFANENTIDNDLQLLRREVLEVAKAGAWRFDPSELCGGADQLLTATSISEMRWDHRKYVVDRCSSFLSRVEAATVIWASISRKPLLDENNPRRAELYQRVEMALRVIASAAKLADDFWMWAYAKSRQLLSQIGTLQSCSSTLYEPEHPYIDLDYLEACKTAAVAAQHVSEVDVPQIPSDLDAEFTTIFASSFRNTTSDLNVLVAELKDAAAAVEVALREHKLE